MQRQQVPAPGFFKQSGDISLNTNPYEPLVPQVPQAPLAQPALTQPVTPPVAIERQMDRSLEEHARAQAEAATQPQGINAAFDGNTSSKDR